MNLKNLDSAFSSKPRITDQFNKGLTNSGQTSVEKGSRLDFHFDFTLFRGEGVLRNESTAVQFLAVPQAALILCWLSKSY